MFELSFSLLEGHCCALWLSKACMEGRHFLSFVFVLCPCLFLACSGSVTWYSTSSGCVVW